MLSQLKDYHKAFSDFRDKRGYVDLLERELERSRLASRLLRTHYSILIQLHHCCLCRSHTSDLQKELNERAILGLAKDDSLRLTESKLHQAESTIHELRQKQAKFTFQIHDMKTKQHIGMTSRCTVWCQDSENFLKLFRNEAIEGRGRVVESSASPKRPTERRCDNVSNEFTRKRRGHTVDRRCSSF